jgi:alkylhydroperoxidase/carboxymuconolactone decarboxylase family protein YurZ
MTSKEMAELLPQWRVLNNQDPELGKKVEEWRTHLYSTTNLPRKYKELIMMTMNCARRFEIGIELHMESAAKFGATKEEIFEALTLTLLNGGFPSFRAGAYVFNKLFPMENE